MRPVVYLEGLDEETTVSMVEAYAEEWGGELAEAVQVIDGTARIVFAFPRDHEKFMKDTHYLNDQRLRVIEMHEPELRRPPVPRDFPLDQLFWNFCGALLQRSIEELSETPEYATMREAILQHAASNERRMTPISLSYTSVWGPLSHADMAVQYPDGISYSPEEDRIYFRDVDALFYGLQKWYHAMLNVIPENGWLRQRTRDFDRVLTRIHVSLETDDLLSHLQSARIA